MQAEHPPAEPVIRPGGDQSDRAVAVFQGEGELADLMRRTHDLPLALWHATLEHERLGAPADAARQRLDQDFARPGVGQALAPQLALPWRHDPERQGVRHRSGIRTGRPAQIELAHGRSQAVAQASDLRQRDARATRADDQRRDRDLQPMQAAGGEKARHGDPAAFDEHAPETALSQKIEDRIGYAGSRPRPRRRSPPPGPDAHAR